MGIVQRTQAFYDWEVRGRGWLQWEHNVPLEPPFAPFSGWCEQRIEQPDDGKRETFLSRLVESFRQPLELKEAGPSDESTPPSVEAGDFEELTVLIPQDTIVDRADVIAWIHSLSGLRNRAVFEIHRRDGRVELRIAASPNDVRNVTGQLVALIPDVSFRRPDTSLIEEISSSSFETAAVMELGLASEFMVPLADTVGDEPLLEALAMLADLPLGSSALVQVLFEPTVHPWREQVMAAVETPSGKPFFADAPEITKEAAIKVASPMFAVAVRVAAFERDEEQSALTAERLAETLSFASGVRSNQLIPVGLSFGTDGVTQIVHRSSRRSGMLLSAEELALLTKLPGKSVLLEPLVRPLDRTKNAPADVLGSGCILGRNEHNGELEEVSLDETARMKHVHVLGASGVGKSTLLVRMILNDIEAGYGVGVLDPHGDLVREVASRMPESRVDDVVLFDPSAEDRVVGWNVLQATSDTERELLTSDLVGVFRRLSTSWGDQMNAVLANAIMVFLEPEVGGTLVDLRHFLADPKFRTGVLSRVRDPLVRGFWETEFKLIEKRRPQAPILTRLDSFLRSKSVRRVLNVKNPKIDFGEVTDQGRVFLGNLSMGAIGEDNAALLGSLLVSRFHQVSLMRGAVREEDRRPFYLYIDEFHHVATPSMSSLFSGARKFGLGLTVAHQDLYQLRATAPDLERSLLANAHSRVCFRLGDEDARQLDKGFSYFDADDLMNQQVGQAICRVGTRSDDFNLKTDRLPSLRSGDAVGTFTKVSQRSAERWGADVEEDEMDRVEIAPSTDSELPQVARDATDGLPALEKTAPKRTVAKVDLDYLELVATEPFLGVRERNERLGLSAWKGDQRKKELISEEWVREIEINPGGRGSQFKLLELVPAGREILSDYDITASAGYGRGGLAHQWWVNHITEWLRGRGHKVTVEDDSSGARVDLVTSLSRTRTAIEIDFRAEQAVHNIRKDAEAGFNKIISLVDGVEVADSVRAAVSDLDTISATVADLREFDLILESPGRPNQNRKPEGTQRRRRTARSQPAPRAVVLDGGALDTPMAASYLGLSPATLETMRSRGGGPRFSKLGRRVVYQREELDSWLQQRSQRSTSDT